MALRSFPIRLIGVFFIATSFSVANSARAQEARESTDKASNAVEEILDQPQIPFPEIEPKAIGNRAQIQAMTQTQLAGCARWRDETPKAQEEIQKMTKQKETLENFFAAQRAVLAKLVERREMAMRDLYSYQHTHLSPEQIALAQRTLKELNARIELEQARIAQAEKSFIAANARQTYFMNLDDYFPECYDRYPEQADPEVEALIRGTMTQQHTDNTASNKKGDVVKVTIPPAMTNTQTVP